MWYPSERKKQILTFLLFVSEWSLGEFDVESHVESAFLVVVLVVGHAFVRLPQASPGPRNTISANLDLVTIQVRDLRFETHQSIEEGYGDVREQIVSLEISIFSIRSLSSSYSSYFRGGICSEIENVRIRDRLEPLAFLWKIGCGAVLIFNLRSPGSPSMWGSPSAVNSCS